MQSQLIEQKLLEACQHALKFFDLSNQAAHTLDDDLMDRFDGEMLNMEGDMIPKLREAIAAATSDGSEKVEAVQVLTTQTPLAARWR